MEDRKRAPSERMTGRYKHYQRDEDGALKMRRDFYSL